MAGLIRDRYEELGVLGSGSQGEVLLCLDRQLNRKVAIKSRRVGSPVDRERVLAEARVLLSMRPHPHVALVREDFFEDDRYYIVMDWIEGRSLAKVLTEDGPPPFDDAIRWLAQVAEGIDHVHAHDPAIVHGDVKPANIVLTARGDAVLVDFGVATAAGGEAAKGTRAYAAPELDRDEGPTPASDVYSLGITAYELFTGTLPERDVAPALAMLVSGRRQNLRRGLRAALAPDPTARPASAGAFVGSLRSHPLDLPPTIGLNAASVLVDRTDDMTTFRRLWDEVVGGQQRLALIGGEPGIGKTRLIAEVARMLYDEGATVLFGRTDPEPLSPFQPFVEALSFYVEHCPPGRLEADVPRSAAELTLLLPSLRERVPSLEPVPDVRPEMRRYRLFDAVASLLLAIARDAPLVVVLDDLHWADRSTLALLEHLLGRSGGVPLLIIGAFRESEVAPGHPLADTVAGHRSSPGFAQISLDGLGEGHVADLLAGTIGRGAPGALVRQIAEGTRGNPLFIHEMSRHLVEAGAVDADGRWHEVDLASLGVPRGVSALIESRVARLGESSRAVLDVAAVSGREFDLAVLERVVGGDPLPDIEHAIRARLVQEEPASPGRFSFSHALFRQSIYEGLTTARRVRMHAQIADAIEELRRSEPDARLGDLAHHTYMAARDAGPGEARRALPHSLLAAEAASTGAAFEEAVAHYQRALQLMEASGAAADAILEILLKIAENGSRVGLWTESRQAAHRAGDIARGSGSGDVLARAALSLFGGIFVDPMQVRRADRALLQEALEALPPDDSSARARLMTWRSWLMYSDPRSRPDDLAEIQDLASDALAMARRLGDARTMAFAAVYAAGVRIDPSFSRDLVAATEEAVALARAGGWPDLLGHALEFHATTLIKAGELDAAERVVAELAGFDSPIHVWMATSSRVCIETVRGRFEKAETLAEYGQQLLERGRSTTLQFSHFSAVVELRRLQGRIDEVLPILDAFTDAVPDNPYIRTVLAAALVEVDRLALAQKHLDVLREVGFGKLCSSFLFGRNAMAYLSRVAYALGDVASAEILCAILLPFADIQFGDGRPPAGVHGYGSHYLGMLFGMLGRYEEAQAHFDRALDLYRRMGSPPWIAETQLRIAEMLLSRGGAGDEHRARALLDEAGRVSSAIGAEGLVRRIRAAAGTGGSRRADRP